MSIVDPVNVIKELSKTQPGGKLNTIGNPTNSARDPGDLLKQIQKLDGNKSGVFKNAAEVLKKMRDIISMGGGGGSGGMSGMAAGSAVAAAAGGAGSAVMAQALPAEMDKAQDSELYDALAEAYRILTSVGAVNRYLTVIDEHVVAIVNAPTTATVNLMQLWDTMEHMELEDLQLLPEDVILHMLKSFLDLISCISYCSSYLPAAFALTRIFLPAEQCLDRQDLRGLDKSKISTAFAPLAAAMRGFSAEDEYGLADCASRFEAAIAAPDLYDEDEQVINEVLAEVSSSVHPHMTVAELVALIEKIIKLIAEKNIKKLFGKQPSTDNAASMIPQVGSMVQSTMSQFLPKSDNDKGKIKQALDKFVKNQAIAEKLRDQVKQKLQPNPDPRPASSGAPSPLGG